MCFRRVLRDQGENDSHKPVWLIPIHSYLATFLLTVIRNHVRRVFQYCTHVIDCRVQSEMEVTGLLYHHCLCTSAFLWNDEGGDIELRNSSSE